MNDLISRQAAIDEIKSVYEWHDTVTMERLIEHLNNLQPIQPVATDTNVGDKISKFIDGLEEIFAHLREKHIDDSVCGLCEYDGAYIGPSGDWYNECPGFERDDCFKLSDKTRKEWTDEIIKALPSAQPEPPEECERCMMEHTDEMEKLEAELAMAQPKRGRWISADAIFGGVPFYCSECGENTRDTVMGEPRWNFCPNCGADMREGESDDK